MCLHVSVPDWLVNLLIVERGSHLSRSYCFPSVIDGFDGGGIQGPPLWGCLQQKGYVFRGSILFKLVRGSWGFFDDRSSPTKEGVVVIVFV